MRRRRRERSDDGKRAIERRSDGKERRWEGETDERRVGLLEERPWKGEATELRERNGGTMESIGD